MNIFEILFSFEGRINRTQFWLGQLGLVIAFILVLFIFVSVAQVQNQGEIDKLALLVGLFFLFPYLAVSVKRCHDRDNSGSWVILSFVPIIGIFWFVIELGLLKGTNGENLYDQTEKT